MSDRATKHNDWATCNPEDDSDDDDYDYVPGDSSMGDSES